jgi:hypothetical protein
MYALRKRFVLVENVCKYAIPRDMQHLAQCAHVTPVKMVFGRAKDTLMLTGRVNLEFETDKDASQFAEVCKGYVQSARTLIPHVGERMQLTCPQWLEDCAGRAVLVQGFPHDARLDDIREMFRTYKKHPGDSDWMVQVPSSKRSDYTRFLLKLLSQDEVEHVLVDWHLKPYRPQYPLLVDWMY